MERLNLEHIGHKNHHRKINWSSIVTLVILIFLVTFTAGIWNQKRIQNQRQKIIYQDQITEANRIQKLSYELYELEQYQIQNYFVGVCDGECNKENFIIPPKIKSCEARVRIDTLVLDDVEIIPELRFRVVAVDDSFEYTNKTVIGDPFPVEKRLEQKTIFPTTPRPDDWFCLPPGRYIEQATVHYSYQNELGSNKKNPTYISNIFEIIE